MALRAMQTRVKLFGPDSIATLNSAEILGEVYMLSDRWKEAEELWSQIMEASEEVQGPAHHNTLLSIITLSTAYRNQGRWKEAEEIQAKGIDLCLKAV